MNAGCPFCRPAEILLENDPAYVARDRFPVSPGHHVSDWFETTAREWMALFDLADAAKTWLDGKYHPDGFNLGVNVGEVAGQTLFHVHPHLIPRYQGDVAVPRGGVRGVIPSKQSY